MQRKYPEQQRKIPWGFLQRLGSDIVKLMYTKKILFLLAIIPIIIGCTGKPASTTEGYYSLELNSEAQELVLRGVNSHDQGDYQNAVDLYLQALEIEPEHPVILYQIGFAKIYLRDFDAALEMADRGIIQATRRNLNSLIPNLLGLKASALNNMGRNEEAIDVHLQIIYQYEEATPFTYYNLGVSYYRIEDLDEAAAALKKGLLINPNHAGCNYLLGRISMEEDSITQALYAFCYFLLLEPNTDRSAEAYDTLLYILNNQQDTLNRQNGESIPATLHRVFITMEEYRSSGRLARSPGDEVWWGFYAPFFYRIAVSDYYDTFFRYISYTVDPDADNWLLNGWNEIAVFFDWLNEYME